MTEDEIVAALRAGARLCVGWREPPALEQQDQDAALKSRPRLKHFWLEPCGVEVPVIYAEALIATGVVIGQSDGLFAETSQSWVIAS